MKQKEENLERVGIGITMSKNSESNQLDIREREIKIQTVSESLTKVSLLAVKPCEDPRNFSESNFRRIQLVQKRQYVPIHILTCQVTVQQLIDHCGMHSHRNTVAGGFGKYIQHIEPKQCLKAHQFRQIDLKGMGGGIISILILNGTTEVSATLQGFADVNGRCEDLRFAVGSIQYANVVVTAAISIKLQDYVAVADIERNLVTLWSNGVCPYSVGYYFDDVESSFRFKTDQTRRSLCSKGLANWNKTVYL
ncbi:unnamed protein product [Ceutorhynchus assimilis]|uniref:Uncharacterized protein n=1 Tax=Ceutorhynchus assimilis TaxID=467358 RepID=A0A9N9MG48_9CUCU|nr:unnamed protein product [Ceutorhynchus assimilis]